MKRKLKPGCVSLKRGNLLLEGPWPPVVDTQRSKHPVPVEHASVVSRNCVDGETVDTVPGIASRRGHTPLRSVDASKDEGTVSTTEPERVGQHCADIHLPCSVRHVVEITAVVGVI